MAGRWVGIVASRLVSCSTNNDSAQLPPGEPAAESARSIEVVHHHRGHRFGADLLLATVGTHGSRMSLEPDHRPNSFSGSGLADRHQTAGPRHTHPAVDALRVPDHSTKTRQPREYCPPLGGESTHHILRASVKATMCDQRENRRASTDHLEVGGGNSAGFCGGRGDANGSGGKFHLAFTDRRKPH